MRRCRRYAPPDGKLMGALLLALGGFAILDSLDILLIGVTAAVALDARLRRTSPLKSGLAFIAGVFTATTVFGILAILGIDFLSNLVDFDLTPVIRYRGQLIVGVAFLVLASVRSTNRPPPAWIARFRSSSSFLYSTGVAIGIVQAPTAVPYLAGLAMLSARSPLPSFWIVIVVAYCLIALLPPMVVLALSLGRSRSARRRYRRVVRVLTAYGPVAVRIVFALIGLVAVVDVALNFSQLW